VNRAHSPEHIDMKSAYAEFRDNPDSVVATCCWLTPEIGQCGGGLVAGARTQADHAAQPSAFVGVTEARRHGAEETGNVDAEFGRGRASSGRFHSQNVRTSGGL
jgi:hypothetical protein